MGDGHAGQGHQERRRVASRVVASRIGRAARPAAGSGRTAGAGRGRRSQRHRPAPGQGDPKVLGPPLLLVSSCFPHSRHSRYQPPWGLRRRCQRWSRMRHRQDLTIASSLAMSRAGSARAARSVQTRDRTPVAWWSCSGGVMPYSSARTLGGSAARRAGEARPSGRPSSPTRWAGPPGWSPGTPSGRS